MEKPCPVCKEKANISGTVIVATQNVACPSCGRYEIIRSLRATLDKRILDPKQVNKIQAWIRENQEELLDEDKYQDILNIE